MHDRRFANERAVPQEETACRFQWSHSFLSGQKDEPEPSRVAGVQRLVAQQEQRIPTFKRLGLGDHDGTPIAGIERVSPSSFFGAVEGHVSGKLWLGVSLDFDAAHPATMRQADNVGNGSILSRRPPNHGTLDGPAKTKTQGTAAKGARPKDRCGR